MKIFKTKNHRTYACLKVSWIFFLLIISSSAWSQILGGFKIEKGTQNFGITFSLGVKEITNQDQLIQFVETKKTNAWNVSGEGGYAIFDYVTTGLRLSFGQSGEKSVIIPLNSTRSSVNAFSRQFTLAPYIRNYIPLDKKNIFYITNRLELIYTYESKIKESLTEEILKRQNFTVHHMGLGIRPGLLIMVQKGMGFELSLNVLGLTHVIETSKSTNQPIAKEQSTDIDLKIDILKLNLAFYYYF